MSNQDMITAITNALQTQSNVILLLQAAITNQLPTMQQVQLQTICTILGISTNG